MKSHHNKEVCGLAIHPKREEFLTVGQDGMLGVWDIKTKRQLRYAKLECGANAISYSNEGKHIAIGMLNGYLLVVESEKWAPVAKTQHSSNGQGITVITFSPDNKLCAVGGEDGRIKLYNVDSKFRTSKVIKKSTSPITAIDFEKNGKYFMTNNKAQEILFFESHSGRHFQEFNIISNLQWHTWSCPLGQPVQGIMAANSDGTDIQCCSRAPDGGVIATGDQYGCINLFKYPCPQPDAARSKYVGHSAAVKNLSFSLTSNHLISCGGEDLAIFQW